MRFTLLRRWSKSRAHAAPALPQLGRFGRDVHAVMSGRIARAMTGDLSAVEARRMVLEKASAGLRAPLAYGRALLEDGPHAAGRAFFEVYDKAVRANRKRLRKRRWFGWG
jgi:hypothetical protein